MKSVNFVNFVQSTRSCIPDYVAIVRAAGRRDNPEELSAPVDPRRERDRSPEGVRGDALLVESRLLGESVWLVRDDHAAAELRRELERDGDKRLIFTVTEVEALRGMAEADARTLASVKRMFPGGVLSVPDRIG